MFQLGNSTASSKTTHNKDEGAPLLYFIDALNSESYINPITPIPSRVDKLFLGQSCGFIIPTQFSTVKIADLEYTFNLHLLYEKFLENFLFYARVISQQIRKRLVFKNVEVWWEKSNRYVPMIRNYQEDIDFILRSYLEAFKWYKTGMENDQALRNYSDMLIKYFSEKIEYNSIEIRYKNKLDFKKMFHVKDEYRYPNVVKYDNFDIISETYRKKLCIPIFIYDDLLECLLYNKQILDLRINPSLSPEDVGVVTNEDLEEKYKEAKELKIYNLDFLEKENYIITTPPISDPKIPIRDFKKYILDQDIRSIYNRLEDLELTQFLN